MSMIRLKSSDNEVFEVEESIASQMATIKAMIDDGCADGIFPLPNVSSKVLAKVIEYCRKHAEVGEDQSEGDDENEKAKHAADKAQELKAWDSDFIGGPSPDLFDILSAANYLSHKGLMDLICQAIADAMKDEMPEQIRTMFNIECDFTPEEEAAIRKENEWAFQDVKQK